MRSIVGGLAAALVFSSAASAAIITTIYRGTIDVGEDLVGHLGTPGADLTGRSYAAAFTIDTSINRYNPDASSDAVVGPDDPEATSPDNPFLSAVVTIDGTPIPLPLFGRNYAYVDTLLLIHESSVLAPNYWSFSTSHAGIPNNLDTPFNVVLGAGDLGGGTVELYDEHGDLAFAFQGTVRRVSSAVTIGSIPEPATWALLILGFGTAGAMLRRSRAVA